jgi:hypothetical protein
MLGIYKMDTNINLSQSEENPKGKSETNMSNKIMMVAVNWIVPPLNFHAGFSNSKMMAFGDETLGNDWV